MKILSAEAQFLLLHFLSKRLKEGITTIFAVNETTYVTDPMYLKQYIRIWQLGFMSFQPSLDLLKIPCTITMD
mgnify:CR=1 FL=1